MSRRIASSQPSRRSAVLAVAVVALALGALIVYAALSNFSDSSPRAQAQPRAVQSAPTSVAVTSNDFNTPVAPPQSLPNAAQSTPSSSTTKNSDPSLPLAPNFSITTIDNQKFALSEKRGKVVGLFFSASWCGSCLPEANAWGKVYAKYRDKGLEVLIVDLEASDEVENVLDFKRLAQGGDHAWAIDKTGALVKAFRVVSLDTTIIIGRDGRIVYRDGVPTPLSMLERFVVEALQ